MNLVAAVVCHLSLARLLQRNVADSNIVRQSREPINRPSPPSGIGHRRQSAINQRAESFVSRRDNIELESERNYERSEGKRVHFMPQKFPENGTSFYDVNIAYINTDGDIMCGCIKYNRVQHT